MIPSFVSAFANPRHITLQCFRKNLLESRTRIIYGKKCKTLSHYIVYMTLQPVARALSDHSLRMIQQLQQHLTRGIVVFQMSRLFRSECKLSSIQLVRS